LLIKKFVKNLSQSDNKVRVQINRIIKRGKINNEKEYNLLLKQVEEIYLDIARKKEVEVINNLLATYSK
jgi:thymidylate kinase